MTKKSSGKGDGLTPLMRQYYRLKDQYPDKIMFFRMGDFYEMFGDDAVKAAPILKIALTTRGQVNGEKIPLAGVPYHSAEKYLARLLKAGEKVVIVEQVEDPKTATGVVKRDVVEILTPGTATIDGAIDETDHNFLASVYADGEKMGLAYIDLTTGKFELDEDIPDSIMERLRVLDPHEVIIPEEKSKEGPHALIQKNERFGVTLFEGWNYDTAGARRELGEFLGVSTLDGFGISDMPLGLAAAGAIYRYLKENHRTKLDHIKKITRSENDNHMMLDYGTIRNLELIRNLSENSEKDSLFHAVNRTLTAGGARRLKDNLVRPFKRLQSILYRQNGVKELYNNRDEAAEFTPLLKKLPDLQRLAGSLGMHRINPKQLEALCNGLETGREIVALCRRLTCEIFINIAKAYPECRELTDTVREALRDEPPIPVTKGGIIRRGYSAILDKLIDSIKDAKNYIATLQTTERERTGIGSLKVSYNKVFGYYIEVTKIHLEKVPEEYIRKQTLVNAERFITDELKEKEDLILAAEEKIFSLEEKLYHELVAKAAESLEDIILAGELLAEIDLVTALANLAAEKLYCCPEIDESTELQIIEGRHAVIESILPPGSFIANDVELAADEDRIMILTGPNMSGKSTFLRQAGLIVILAQIGSFVPADKARIGLVDRVFTRVGAIDNLARGQSTFLVEMIETSNIMHNAGERSLILLDEVGRGTSTFDGLSIAWSVVEYLNENIKARTIFATHYHELTGLAALYDRVVNFQVSVKRWEDRVIFLHKIISGGCDDSYGIEVARLAGVPRKAIVRARELLKLLESGKFSQSELACGVHRNIVQRSLFDAKPSPVVEELKKISIYDITPLEAIRILNELKEMADEN